MKLKHDFDHKRWNIFLKRDPCLELYGSDMITSGGDGMQVNGALQCKHRSIAVNKNSYCSRCFIWPLVIKSKPFTKERLLKEAFDYRSYSMETTLFFPLLPKRNPLKKSKTVLKLDDGCGRGWVVRGFHHVIGRCDPVCLSTCPLPISFSFSIFNLPLSLFPVLFPSYRLRVFVPRYRAFYSGCDRVSLDFGSSVSYS